MWWSRRALLASAGAGAAAALGGCGFQLRQSASPRVRSIALTGFAPRSPLALALKEGLERGGVRVEADASKAELVLQALADERRRRVVAITAAAQVREVELRLSLRWRTHTPAGREVTAPVELTLVRDMSYNEAQALAKQYEEEDLYREMQADVVSQVLRRLSVIGPG
jgi:LPS-assembly lipoprotein